MTLRRTFAITSLVFLLCTGARGQHTPGLSGTLQLNEQQLHALDSLAADSTAGKLNIPNVFTPNGDQINDYFEVSTDGSTVYEFMIFTRTGTRVFHANSPRIFWDGKSNGGLDVKEGIYYYVIEQEGEQDPFRRAGFIYLYR
jgi:gliding motility-associated-like protein